MDWPSAQEQITGWQKPKHRCFSTRTEAQRFLDDDNQKYDENPDSPPASMEGFFNSLAPDSASDPTTQQPAQKKAKKLVNGNKAGKLDIPEYNEVDYEAGTGPLPPGAEDGFDPNIMLDPETGEVVYKTQEQRQSMRPAPKGATDTGPIRIHTDGSAIGNGTAGAFAGVGVYFGPGDSRYKSSHREIDCALC